MDILKLIGELLGAILTGIVLYLTPKLKDLILSKCDDSYRAEIEAMIKAFVYGAQQMYWREDGSVRKQYVVDQLEAIGIKVTEEVNAQIEAFVLELPKEGGADAG